MIIHIGLFFSVPVILHICHWSVHIKIFLKEQLKFRIILHGFYIGLHLLVSFLGLVINHQNKYQDFGPLALFFLRLFLALKIFVVICLGVWLKEKHNRELRSKSQKQVLQQIYMAYEQPTSLVEFNKLVSKLDCCDEILDIEIDMIKNFHFDEFEDD